MLTVALIFGGRSAEHEISLASARFVAKSLAPDDYSVVPVGIRRDGAWVLPDDLDAALDQGLESAPCRRVALLPDPSRPGLQCDDGSKIAIDFAFPIIHGTYGEDGTIQGLFEMAGIAYAGSGVPGSSVGMDKELMKAAFAAWGLPQVDYVVFRDAGDRVSACADQAESALPYPMFVKPANLGSSVGMTKAHDRGELEPALELAFRYDRKVMVEATAVGLEVECAVLGNDEPEASVPGLVEPANEYYDYESKYTDGMMTFTIPAPIDEGATALVRELAVRAFRAVDCCGFARCDTFVTDGGQVLINEINTIPGMTRFSAFPRLWAATGVDAPRLVDRIVRLGLEQHRRRSALLTTR